MLTWDQIQARRLRTLCDDFENEQFSSAGLDDLLTKIRETADLIDRPILQLLEGGGLRG